MTVLVIGDDYFAEQTLTYLFECEGFAVKSGSYGNSGLQVLPGVNPSVVLLDIRLPKLGREICKAIRASAPLVPIIVVSEASEIADKVLLLGGGADDYVTKPFSPQELLARVRAAIRRNASRCAMS